MNILAIDTATEVLSVALSVGSGGSRITAPASGSAKSAASRRLYSVTRDVGLRHTRLLMPLVGALLSETGLTARDLDLVACMRGPGSFTGLRIGMSTAKGLAAAIASVRQMSAPPLVSIPTLEVMAHAVPAGRSLIVPVIDGRKNRFYATVFRAGQRLTEDLDLDAGAIMKRVMGFAETAGAGDREEIPGFPEIVITGPHAALFHTRIDSPSHVLIDPCSRRGHAQTLLPLAMAVYSEVGPDSAGQGPVYIRGSDAEMQTQSPDRD